MHAPEAPLRPLLEQARFAAKSRKTTRPTTLHLLLVVLQRGGAASDLLEACGVREGDLLRAISVAGPPVDEPASAVDLTVEHAGRLAAARGAPADPKDLLQALTTNERTAAHRWLTGTAHAIDRLRESLRGRSDKPSSSRPAIDPAGGGPVFAPACQPCQPCQPRRPPLASRQPSGAASRAVLLAASRPAVARLRPERPGPQSPRPAAPKVSARPGHETPRREHAAGRSKSAHARTQRTTPMSGASSASAARSGASTAQAPVASGDPKQRKLAPYELDPKKYPLLATLGRNLTALAANGVIDPVIGRDREIDQLLDILARRKANNPVVIGPAGVGKTAVVEGLAVRFAKRGDDVCGLGARIIVETSAGALVAGTGVRGAVAEKMRQLREELLRAEGRVILFIDEIHSVVGSGEGPDDLAHELKGALARGDFPAIGATTEAEYRKHVEKDPALARRFTPIVLREPPIEDAVAVLEGLLPRYASHHGVRYAADAARFVVEMSARYLTERLLPEKAIGLVDLAGARAHRRGETSVSREALAEVVSEQAQVPVERVLMRDGERLLRLEKLVADRVVGHAEVMGRIAELLRKNSAGFHGKRPLGTLLLLGPTGVGKTETAKAIAEVLFPAGAITRLDMSDFTEAHAIARLLGSPPGYVGHDDGGQLTESVRRRPYQLVLLDEIEKAHRDVLLALLPVLDEGHMTDGRGRFVDFTKTVICMTSNLGAEVPARSSRIGFDGGGDLVPALREAAISSARRALPPELWNRIDEPLYFAPLGRDEVRTIAERFLASVVATVAREHGVELVVHPSVVDALLEAGGFDPTLGARPMRRTVGRLVEAPVAARLLAGDIPRGSVIVLRGDGATVRVDAVDRASVDA